jgi:hypothetical protein
MILFHSFFIFYDDFLYYFEELGEGPTTVSDYGLVRRQFRIFERALKKFKDDIGLWIEYISVAKKEGAKTLAGRLIGRAIQMHPTTASLYILGASHELEQQAPSAARTLLQRGLRLNRTSVDLWREYVKMEIEFVSLVQKRWSVLGIGASESDGPGEDGARSAILQGAIVKQAISSAVSGMYVAVCSGATTDRFNSYCSSSTALPTVPMIESLSAVISTHARGDLQHVLADHLSVELDRVMATSEPLIRLRLASLDGVEAKHRKMTSLVESNPSLRNLHVQLASEWAGTQD